MTNAGVEPVSGIRPRRAFSRSVQFPQNSILSARVVSCHPSHATRRQGPRRRNGCLRRCSRREWGLEWSPCVQCKQAVSRVASFWRERHSGIFRRHAGQLHRKTTPREAAPPHGASPASNSPKHCNRMMFAIKKGERGNENKK